MLADEALWQEFAAESEEHLDAVERLVAAPWEPGAVDSLFRAFHSIKGMSAALGAPGMQDVAHRCEDILFLARQGRLAISGPVVDGLLAAVDALRRQRNAVLQRRADAPAPADLLFRLAALGEASSETRGLASSGPPEPVSTVSGAASPLLTFAGMLRQAVPRLASLARGTEPAMASGAATPVELASHARALGLVRVAVQLERLAAGGGGGTALPLLGGLRRQMQVLAAVIGEEAGAGELADLLVAEAGDGGLRPMLAALAIRLQDLATGAAPDGFAAAAAARTAGEVAAALGFDALESRLLMAEDLADRIADPDAAALMVAEAPALVEHLRLCAEEGGPAMLALPASAQPAIYAVPGSLRLPPEFARLLGPTGQRRLQEALAGGSRVYRARLGVPASAEEERAVQVWLDAQGAEALTSRTLLDTTPPTLDLLFAAPADLEALEAARSAFDPAGRLVQALSALLAELVPDPAEGVAIATAAPPVVPGATMRVRQETIDDIITLETEMRAAALAVGEALRDGAAHDLPAALGALARRLPGKTARELTILGDRLGMLQERISSTEARLSLGLRRLGDAVLQLRVVPIGTLFARLPRVVRSVAQAAGKEVELVMEGQEVTIDRSLVELLADPLLHLVRNAVDHGIEIPNARRNAGKPARAVIGVRARRHAAEVRVEVSDDGRGIDRAAVLRVALIRGLVTETDSASMSDEAAHALLFRAGFSTSERISETSGRGVGLDVVQDAVRRAGGEVEVSSTPGRGTVFALTMPLSAAMAPVLLVEVAGHPYALPAARVEMVSAAADFAAWAANAGAINVGAEAMGVVSLARLLGLSTAQEEGVVVVLRQSGGRNVALSVDRVQRRTDLLLRPMHPALAALSVVGGVGVLSDGNPVLVLDPDGIVVA